MLIGPLGDVPLGGIRNQAADVVASVGAEINEIFAGAFAEIAQGVTVDAQINEITAGAEAGVVKGEATIDAQINEIFATGVVNVTPVWMEGAETSGEWTPEAPTAGSWVEDLPTSGSGWEEEKYGT